MQSFETRRCNPRKLFYIGVAGKTACNEEAAVSKAARDEAINIDDAMLKPQRAEPAEFSPDALELLEAGTELARQIKRLVIKEMDKRFPGDNRRKGVTAMVASIIDYRINEIAATDAGGAPRKIWESLNDMINEDSMVLGDDPDDGNDSRS